MNVKRVLSCIAGFFVAVFAFVVAILFNNRGRADSTREQSKAAREHKQRADAGLKQAEDRLSDCEDRVHTISGAIGSSKQILESVRSKKRSDN